MDDGNTEVSPNLASRYCELLDVIADVDLEYLNDRIAAMTRLRDAVVALRAAGVNPPGEEPEEPRPGRRIRPRGYWPDVVDAALASGPKTIREIAAAVNPDAPAEVEGIVRTTLYNNRHRFAKVPGSEPSQYGRAGQNKGVGA